MLVTDFMVCLVAIIAFCVFVSHKFGYDFLYSVALSFASCTVFSLAFGITYFIVRG